MSRYPDLRSMAWWPAIAAALAKPWPHEAALHDLLWWRCHCEAHGVPTPGRRTLRERWGWSERATRKILRDEASATEAIPPTVSAIPHATMPAIPHDRAVTVAGKGRGGASSDPTLKVAGDPTSGQAGDPTYATAATPCDPTRGSRSDPTRPTSRRASGQSRRRGDPTVGEVGDPTLAAIGDPTCDPTFRAKSDPTREAVTLRNDPTSAVASDPTDPTRRRGSDPTLNGAGDPTLSPLSHHGDPTRDAAQTRSTAGSAAIPPRPGVPTRNPWGDPTRSALIPPVDPTWRSHLTTSVIPPRGHRGPSVDAVEHVFGDPTSDPGNDPTPDPTCDPSSDPTCDPAFDVQPIDFAQPSVPRVIPLVIPPPIPAAIPPVPGEKYQASTGRFEQSGDSREPVEMPGETPKSLARAPADPRARVEKPQYVLDASFCVSNVILSPKNKNPPVSQTNSEPTSEISSRHQRAHVDAGEGSSAPHNGGIFSLVDESLRIPRPGLMWWLNGETSTQASQPPRTDPTCQQEPSSIPTPIRTPTSAQPAIPPAVSRVPAAAPGPIADLAANEAWNSHVLRADGTCRPGVPLRSLTEPWPRDALARAALGDARIFRLALDEYFARVDCSDDVFDASTTGASIRHFLTHFAALAKWVTGPKEGAGPHVGRRFKPQPTAMELRVQKSLLYEYNPANPYIPWCDRKESH